MDGRSGDEVAKSENGRGCLWTKWKVEKRNVERIHRKYGPTVNMDGGCIIQILK